MARAVKYVTRKYAPYTARNAATAITLISVSYTHLDVYKRQT